ncbi:hypothetical protein AB2B41_12760 [Marimonas sp. MJW-29]|uniref:MORN repeat-containing protein n=1 Tax=Sulfitobacter sediminis TaxID=3234186 RepID=A0ABV3RNE0_9RHOB
MKSLKFIPLAACLLFPTPSSASSLPDCPSSTEVVWNNCYGKHTYSDGGEYVGEWKNDEPHGFGVLTETNGWRYVGEWGEVRPTVWVPSLWPTVTSTKVSLKMIKRTA